MTEEQKIAIAEAGAELAHLEHMADQDAAVQTAVARIIGSCLYIEKTRGTRIANSVLTSIYSAQTGATLVRGLNR